MKKLIIFILIVVILFIAVVFHGSNDKSKVKNRQNEIHSLISKDGGRGISIAKASEHNDMFHGFLEDTLNFEHHKATIAGLKHQWDTSVKPNQVLPKPVYDNTKPQPNTNENVNKQKPTPVQQDNGSGSSSVSVTYNN